MKKKRLLLTFITASVFIFGFCGACASKKDASRSEDSESVVSSEESVDNGASESVASSEESVDNSASENDRIDPIVLPDIEI